MAEKTKKIFLGADESFEMTFIALMLLLLCFMVIMVSLAQIDDPRFREAIGSVKGAFSLLKYARQSSMVGEEGSGVLPFRGDPAKAREEAAAVEKTIDEIVGEKLPGMVEVAVVDGGLELILGSLILFAPGETDFTREASPVLDEIASLINDWSAKAEVAGHTDDLPIHTSRFPSNWDLSVARAVEVVRYLESRGVPGERLKAVGYGSSRPIYPNDDEAHRILNRRVEIRLDLVDE